MYEYRAKLIKCVDGDTADFVVDLGFKLFAQIRARLIDVDTPERGQDGFKMATAMLENLIMCKQDDDGYVIIKTHKTGKYGRWLVEIDGVNTILAERWPYV